MRTTKVQISQRSHAVWSVPLFFLLPRQYYTYTCYIQNFQTVANLWAGWFGCKPCNMAHMSHFMRKPVLFYAYATTKVQISLRICAVWSDLVVRCLNSFYIRNFEPLASFCGCAGRFVCLPWLKTPKTGFLVTRLIFFADELAGLDQCHKPFSAGKYQSQQYQSKTHTHKNMLVKSSDSFWQKLYEPRHEKTCLCHMPTTKVHISLHIHAALLFAAKIV